jgi:hypothetical protein
MAFHHNHTVASKTTIEYSKVSDSGMNFIKIDPVRPRSIRGDNNT